MAIERRFPLSGAVETRARVCGGGGGEEKRWMQPSVGFLPQVEQMLPVGPRQSV